MAVKARIRDLTVREAVSGIFYRVGDDILYDCVLPGVKELVRYVAVGVIDIALFGQMREPIPRFPRYFPRDHYYYHYRRI